MDGAYKLEAMSVALTELEAAWQRKHDAGESFKVACDSVAQQCGLEPSVVKGYITARMTDKLDAQAKKAEQMSLLFDNLVA